MDNNQLAQSVKGVIATLAAIACVVLPIIWPDGSATKWVMLTVAVAGALGVIVVPNAPTPAQYQQVARDVLGTSLVEAVVTRDGKLNVATTDNTPTTVTITPNPEQGPYVNTNPSGAADLSRNGNGNRHAASSATNTTTVYQDRPGSELHASASPDTDSSSSSATSIRPAADSGPDRRRPTTGDAGGLL